MSIFKRILAIVAGVAVGGIFVQIGDTTSGMLMHIPPDFNPKDEKAIADLAAHAPLSCLLVMLLGYIVGAFVGGLIATVISGREASRPAMIVGILLTIGGLINMKMIPHPLWFNIVSTLVYIPSAWFGYYVLKRKTAA